MAGPGAGGRGLLGARPHLGRAGHNAGPVVGERLGKVEEGYLADLVVVDGHPTSDIRILLDPAKVGPVIKSGRVLPTP